MTSPSQTLADQFATQTADEWQQAVEKALRGAPFQSLVTQTADDIEVRPIYPGRSDVVAQAGRPGAVPWMVSQRVDHPDAATANKMAIEDLSGGAPGLTIVERGAPTAYGFGTDLSDGSLATMLDGIHLDMVDLRLEPAKTDPSVITAIASVLQAHSVSSSNTTGSFGFDPIGNLSASGTAIPGGPTESVRQVAARAADVGISWRLLEADGRPYGDAGASTTLELAAIISTGVAYLRALEEAGQNEDQLANTIGLTISADGDQFMTIAKIRALRRLWRRVLDASGISSLQPHVHAQTSWRMMTRRDPHVNILRATMASFAAGLGGADSITVLPFSQAVGLPDEFSRRVARNSQIILLEESNLSRVQDAGAGSGHIEDLTEQLAGRAWSQFQKFERTGGIVAAIEDGTVQTAVAKDHAEQMGAVAKRKHRITGTSAFPEINDRAIEVMAPMPESTTSPAAGDFVSLQPTRLSQPFEALRDKSDATQAATGARPSVFLANLGPLSDFTARAAWTKNFFETGGIEAPSNEGFDGLDGLITNYRNSGAAIACLCGIDATYAYEAADTARALTAAGATLIALAGRPGDHATSWADAGVTHYLYEGCDAIETLEQIHSHLADQ